jgi:hypothetical protein
MNKQYDLEERTFLFARRVRKFIRNLKLDLCNIYNLFFNIFEFV